MKRFIEATAAMLAWAAGILAVRYCENPWLVAAGAGGERREQVVDKKERRTHGKYRDFGFSP